MNLQLGLLYICILYRPRHEPVSTRPFSWWQWQNYSTYIEFLAGLMCVVMPRLTALRLLTPLTVS